MTIMYSSAGASLAMGMFTVCDGLALFGEAAMSSIEERELSVLVRDTALSPYTFGGGGTMFEKACVLTKEVREPPCIHPK